MAKIHHLTNPSNLAIGSPCDADWTAMIGDDKIRFCESCQKNVHNLSRMDEREIRRHMREVAGQFCIRVEPNAASPIAQSVIRNMVRISAVAAASMAFAQPQHPPMPKTELAQRQLAQIEGKVVDATGAVIVGAKVQLFSSDETVLSYSSKSDKSGAFLLDELKPGKYLLRVEVPGFVQSNFAKTVRAGETVATTIILQVGSMGGSIDVERLPSKLKRKLANWARK